MQAVACAIIVLCAGIVVVQSSCLCCACCAHSRLLHDFACINLDIDSEGSRVVDIDTTALALSLNDMCNHYDKEDCIVCANHRYISNSL